MMTGFSPVMLEVFVGDDEEKNAVDVVEEDGCAHKQLESTDCSEKGSGAGECRRSEGPWLNNQEMHMVLTSMRIDELSLSYNHNVEKCGDDTSQQTHNISSPSSYDRDLVTVTATVMGPPVLVPIPARWRPALPDPAGTHGWADEN
ncbi:unnamed protein product, partial [Mycena citricolor]